MVMWIFRILKFLRKLKIFYRITIKITLCFIKLKLRVIFLILRNNFQNQRVYNLTPNLISNGNIFKVSFLLIGLVNGSFKDSTVISISNALQR